MEKNRGKKKEKGKNKKEKRKTEIGLGQCLCWPWGAQLTPPTPLLLQRVQADPSGARCPGTPAGAAGGALPAPAPGAGCAGVRKRPGAVALRLNRSLPSCLLLISTPPPSSPLNLPPHSGHAHAGRKFLAGKNQLFNPLLREAQQPGARNPRTSHLSSLPAPTASPGASPQGPPAERPPGGSPRAPLAAPRVRDTRPAPLRGSAACADPAPPLRSAPRGCEPRRTAPNRAEPRRSRPPRCAPSPPRRAAGQDSPGPAQRVGGGQRQKG